MAFVHRSLSSKSTLQDLRPLVSSFQRQELTTSTTASTSLSLSPMSSSTWLLSDAASDIDIAVPTTSVYYDPIMPQTEALVGMGVIVILCVITGWVWANQVVPNSRTNLAISKNRGEVKQYLDGLKKAAASDDASNVLVVEENLEEMVNASANKQDAAGIPKRNDDSRAFERWLFTDWLQDNKSSRKAGRQKEPALPILKDAKWNSGDNPVLAAAALIGLGVLFTAITERVVSLV